LRIVACVAPMQEKLKAIDNYEVSDMDAESWQPA
jgi:hypothetical protein